MARFNLAVPNFHIASTRSRNKDTLFASVGLTVLNANGSLHKAWPAQSVALGDHEDKVTVNLNLPYTLVDVPEPTPENPDGGSINWVFLLMNSGHSDSGFTTLLNKATDAFAGGAAGKTFDGGPTSIITLSVAAGLLAGQEVLAFLTADCDGMVAAGAHSITAAQLLAMTAHSSWDNIEPNPGTNSPSGCGDNSMYFVKYFIERTTPFDSMQQDWRSCVKCHSLFFLPINGACPAGGKHDPAGSFGYQAVFNANAENLQSSWQSCTKCQCINFKFPAPCAGGGQHDGAGSFNYQVRFGTLASEFVQDGWAACSKCRTLYFLSQGGPCPGGGQHDATGSFNYLVDF